jgi:hypothetical protein
MHAARIVAEHAADRAVIMRRGIGPEGEPVLVRRIADAIEHDARLATRELLHRIDFD